MSNIRKYIATTIREFLNENMIGRGSSREVYEEGNSVIKKAYVPIGIFQNEIEVNLSEKSDVNSILNIVYEFSSDFKTIKVKRASPISEEDIIKYIPCFWYLEKYLMGSKMVSDECNDKLNKDEFVQKLVILVNKYDLSYMDLTKYDSYGLVDGKLKLIDFGLTTLYNKDDYEKLM